MELNEKIQQLRKQKGLTQEELAAQLYVSRTAISKWCSHDISSTKWTFYIFYFFGFYMFKIKIYN